MREPAHSLPIFLSHNLNVHPGTSLTLWDVLEEMDEVMSVGYDRHPFLQKDRVPARKCVFPSSCELHSSALCRVLLCSERPVPPFLKTLSPKRDLDTGIRINQDGILCSYEGGGRELNTCTGVSQDGILCSYEGGRGLDTGTRVNTG